MKSIFSSSFIFSVGLFVSDYAFAGTPFSIHLTKVQYAPLDLSIIANQAESMIWKDARDRCLIPLRVSEITYGSVLVQNDGEVETASITASAVFRCDQ
jgi:hypothetical protein